MNLIGFDLETSGLQPWRSDAEIYSMSSHDTEKYVCALPTKEQLRTFLRSNRADTGQVIVGWNVMFDIAWLMAYDLHDEVRACRWLDGMLLLKRVDGWRQSYGLKTVVAETWPQHAGYGIDDFSRPTTQEGWDKLLEYNHKDVVFTLALAKQYLSQLNDKEIAMALTEAECLPELAQSWLDGINIDVVALASLAAQNKVDLAEWLAVTGLTTKVIASPKQLATALYDNWSLPILARTDKGAPSTSKDAINLLAVELPGDERLKALLEVRKCITKQGKYIDAVYKSIEYNEATVTHPQPQAGGTYTSRLTYSSKQGKGKQERQTGIALHQWSRDKRVRAELTAPEGSLLAEFDFSGQEMRLMADASMDDTMLSLFLDGVDGHSFMGASIEGVDWKWVHQEQDNDPAAKSARYLGKFANLSLQYRIGIDTMRIRALTQYGLNLSVQRATMIKGKYLSTYPEIATYWNKSIRLAMKNGYAETRGGHRIQLDFGHEDTSYAAEQTAINFPIQGTGGDMKLLALAVVKNHFAEMGVKFAWDLHDALFLYIPDDYYVVKKALKIQQMLSNLPYKQAWGWEPLVPLPVDCKIGKTWGSLKGL